MVISWTGGGSFKIQAGDLALITDPDRGRGVQSKADIILRTLISWPLASNQGSPSFEIYGPGQYEIKGVMVEGLLLEKESAPTYLKTVYTVEIDEMKLGFLGHLSLELGSELEAKFKNLDVLFTPVGGKPYLEPVPAAKLCRQLEPKIIIPGFFKNPPETFLKELNQTSVRAEGKFSFRKKELADLKLRVVLLESKNA